MKKFKRLAALIAAVLMVVTMFGSAIQVAAADIISAYVGDHSQSGYTISMYRSTSNLLVFARTDSKVKATRIATTILTTVVDKKGNQVAPVNVDKAVDNDTSSGNASASSTAKGGYKFVKVVIYHSALFNNKTEVYKSATYTYS